MKTLASPRKDRAALRRMHSAASLPSAGFTLIELLVTLTIVGVIAMIAMPSFKTLADNQQIKTGASDYHTALLYARSEALKRAADVDVIPNAGDWKKGWSVKLGTTVLRSHAALSGQLDAVPVGSAAKVTYQNDGRVVAAPDTAVFRISSNTQAVVRCVDVDLSGRPTLVADTNNNPSDGCS